MSVTLRWLPNSWIEIMAPEAVVHIDPAVSPSVPVELPDDLEPADLVLITHHHRDHCDSATLARVAGPGTPVYASALCAASLDREATAVKAGDEFDVAGVHVEVVPAYNTPEGSSTDKAHVQGEGVGFIITIDDMRIYHAGDTDLVPEMRHIEDIDIALLPIGGTFTMNAEEAARAALTIEPALAIPIHSRDTDPGAFAMRLEDSDVDVMVLSPGESVDIEVEDDE
jgi:L-ascorbate metabolism protein UlaG (beta-lactamase superfamily)